MKRKKVVSLVIVAVLIFSVTTAAFAWFMSHDKITNRLITDSVDAYIQEVKWTDENGKNFRIGDTVSKNPTVTANDGDSYIKVDMTIINSDGVEVTDQSIIDYICSFMYYDPENKLKTDTSYTSTEIASLGLLHYNSDFQFSDGAFYLKSNNDFTILKEGTSKQIFTKICVPCDITKEEWVTKMSPLENFSITFKVKAVLSSSFEGLQNSNDRITDALNTKSARILPSL